MSEHADEIEFGSPEHIAGLSRKALEEDFAWLVDRNRELEGICDRLNAENADLKKRLETFYAVKPDQYGNERFIKLPLDADGVPIHIGDYLESEELGGKRFPCRGLNVEVCDGGKRWTVCASYDSYSGTSEYVASNSCIHVKPRTLEDNLEGLYAKAKAENAELREQGARLFDKTLELGTENTKLRELVQYIMHQCNDGNPRCDDCIGWNDGECAALLRMRELGIEVDG